MNEWQLVWLIALKLIAILFFAICYTIGGRDFRWVRRYLGGFGFVFLVCLASLLDGTFKIIPILILLLFPLGLRFGTGEERTIGKFIPRLIYGFYFGMIGMAIGIFSGHLILGCFHFALALTSSVVLGVFNPVHAVAEEALIAVGISLFIPFMF